MHCADAPQDQTAPSAATAVLDGSPAETDDDGAAGTDAPGTLKAALWDMDGTLVDTEPYWIAAETELVESHGGTWTHEQAMGLVGQALETSAAILQKAGVDLPIRGIVDFLAGRVIERVRVEVPWRPGAQGLLHDLWQNKVRCALVTMSEGPLAAEIVNALPHPYFEFMVTGDMVANGKPHPEPYLAAVERLRRSDPGLGVLDCVALEDSVPGVASAMAAGVATIAIPHVIPLGEAPGRATWPTLSGRTTADLRAELARHAARSPQGARA
ncbi:HAD family hydrolase [Pseudarthrobacter sp. P1]|uniref:HAD family hydrolase n=1 Tax=Pseudarthrobacter sp. P1 TaxID=3418418 RepID=UPI003CEE6E7B